MVFLVFSLAGWEGGRNLSGCSRIMGLEDEEEEGEEAGGGRGEDEEEACRRTALDDEATMRRGIVRFITW